MIPDYDALCQAVADPNLPISNRDIIMLFVCGGIFERHRRLKIAAVERMPAGYSARRRAWKPSTPLAP